MGLMDMLGGLASQALGGSSPNQGQAPAALVQAVVGMLGNHAQGGGLAALVQQFEQAGLGQQVQSWIGTGQNLPISADQVKQALGSGTLGQLAQAAGLSHDDAAAHLAQVLPALIDHVTPQGQVPSGGIEGALASLSGLLK